MPSRSRTVLVVLLGALATAAFSTTMAYVATQMSRMPQSLDHLATLNIAFWFGWATLSFPLVLLARRLRVDRRPRVAVPVHITAVVIASSLHISLLTVDAILSQAPDLVFLDVQMPKLDGFEVINSVGAERMPPVVFVTAFDQHALRAFEVQAMDYLLKPFDQDRFQGALRRVRQQMDTAENGELGKRLLALVRDLKSDLPGEGLIPAPADKRSDRMVVKSGGRLFFLRADEIDLVEAAGNYVRLHVGAESHLLRETMNAIEGRLHPDTFFRIHRSRIVNIERIKELQPWFNGEYVVILRNGTKLTLSRGCREKLQDRLGKPL